MMNPHAIDRIRASTLLQQAGLDALLISEPEAFRYVTGASQGAAGLFRRAGAGFALLPADPSIPLGVVTGDLYAATLEQQAPDLLVRSHPLWIETVAIAPSEAPVEQAIREAWLHARPETFDLRLALAALQEILAVTGLVHGRLGLDLDFVSSNDFRVMQQQLAPACLLDGSLTFNRLRMVKTEAEIARLRLACELAEAGIGQLVREAAKGQSAQDLALLFRHGVAQEARQRLLAPPASWEYISIGPDPWGTGVPLAAETIVKVDVGCIIDGYSSDTSRNFVGVAPSREQARLHAILEKAFAAGLERMGPGLPLAGVHQAVTRSLHQSGLAGFSRGHFGHGLGQSQFSEQWPFISATSHEVFEAGMVMAFEVPLYAGGVGGFNIESQFLITDNGVECMNRLPLQLSTIA